MLPGRDPLRSVHPESFPALLRELSAVLLVTTYQAGKLVVLRADNGGLNTHFSRFDVPMGLALRGDRLAIGTALEIWFVNARFSGLCTRDLYNSCMPQRRPPFISVIAPEDRCHLDGLALVNDDRARIANSFVLPAEPLGLVPESNLRPVDVPRPQEVSRGSNPASK